MNAKYFFDHKRVKDYAGKLKVVDNDGKKYVLTYMKRLLRFEVFF
jgi:hypothetical protein